jgi:hypothetical protein
MIAANLLQFVMSLSQIAKYIVIYKLMIGVFSERWLTAVGNHFQDDKERGCLKINAIGWQWTSHWPAC